MFSIEVLTFALLTSIFVDNWFLLTGVDSKGTLIKENSFGSIKDQWVPFIREGFCVRTIGLSHKFRQSERPLFVASSSIFA